MVIHKQYTLLHLLRQEFANYGKVYILKLISILEVYTTHQKPL